MGVVDHLKGNNPEQKVLEVAIGRHVIKGDLAKSNVTGSSPNHVVTIQQMLGEGFGKGWKGIIGAWFRGTLRPSNKYKFYPGIQSPGNADTVQGIDSVFNKDTPHSNAAWIRLEAPSGSEVGIPDIDTKNNPPEGFEAIVDCQLGDIYDANGNVTSSNVFITNAADAIAFGCKEIRRYPNSRIDFASIVSLRNLCDQLETPDWTTLPQGVGLTASYYDGSNFNTFKTKRIDPVIEFANSADAPALDINVNSFSARYEGKIKAEFTETYTFYLTHDDGGRLWVNNLSTPLIDQWSGGGPHSATIALTAGQFYDIRLEWNETGGNAEFKLEWQSASRSRQTVPQNCLYPKNEAQKKSETHIAFTSASTFADYLSAVLFTCNGEYQDANGKLRFFSLDDTTPVFTFDQSNIVRGTFSHKLRFSQQELLKLPNRFIADGRDLQSRYLEPFDPQVFYDVTDLQELVGVTNEETIFVGNTNRWQCLKNLTHYAKMRTAPKIVEFEGMPHTFPVLPGDFVNVTHPNANYTNKLHLVLEATDKGIGKNADNRIFKLLDWS